MAAIGTVVPMVAHDEVVGFSNHFGAMVFVAPEIRWYIIIGQKDFIHINSSVFDPDRVAFLCDDSLDEGLVRVPRVIQHDDVARLRQTEETVQRFVYDESVLVRQSWFHALTFDPRDLKAEGDNQRGVDCRGCKGLDPGYEFFPCSRTKGRAPRAPVSVVRLAW